MTFHFSIKDSAFFSPSPPPLPPPARPTLRPCWESLGSAHNAQSTNKHTHPPPCSHIFTFRLGLAHAHTLARHCDIQHNNYLRCSLRGKKSFMKPLTALFISDSGWAGNVLSNKEREILTTDVNDYYQFFSLIVLFI